MEQFNTFEQRKKHGQIAEEIVEKYLIQKGNVIHQTNQDIPHAIDFFVTNTKKEVHAIEVKRSGQWYPHTKFNQSDQICFSMNVKHWNDYLDFAIKCSMPFYIFMVDVRKGQLFSAKFLDLVKVTTPDQKGLKIESTSVFPQRMEFQEYFNDKEATILIPVNRFNLIHEWS